MRHILLFVKENNMEIYDLKLQKVTEKVYMLPDFKELDWPVLGLVVGEKHTRILDSGASDRHVNILMKEIERLGLPHPDLCVLTHWHWDHTYGLAYLDDIVSVATKDTNRILHDMQKWKWTDDDMRHRIETGEDLEFSYPNINAEYPDKSRIKIATATIEYNDTLSLDLGGVHLRLKKMENSHSYDSAVIIVEEEKVIFLGDIAYEDLLPVTPAYYTKKHARLITGLRKYNFDKVLAGHQPLMSAEELYSQLENVTLTDLVE